MKRIFYSILYVSMLILFACSHLKVMKYNNEVYPPTSNVDIYNTKLPDINYIEIAELSVRKKDNSIELLVEEAKKIGADGLILLGDEHVGTGYYPVGNLYYGINVRNIIAIAIKYIKSKEYKND